MPAPQEIERHERKSYLVKQNILFVDPLSKTLKPQSKLNLLAIRDMMKDA